MFGSIHSDKFIKAILHLNVTIFVYARPFDREVCILMIVVSLQEVMVDS